MDLGSRYQHRIEQAKAKYALVREESRHVFSQIKTQINDADIDLFHSHLRKRVRSLQRRELYRKITDNHKGRLGKYFYPRQLKKIYYRELLKGFTFFYFRERAEVVSQNQINQHFSHLLSEFNEKVDEVTQIENPVEAGLDLETYLSDIFQFINLIGTTDMHEWIVKSLVQAKEIIPTTILLQGGLSKVVRTIGGVVSYLISDLNWDDSEKLKHDRLNKCLQGGYYYGMLYPLVDDVLDMGFLTPVDKQEFIELITWWIAGDLDRPTHLLKNQVVQHLLNCFKGFHSTFPIDEYPSIYDSCFLLHFSQIEDLRKDFETLYSEEDIYLPVIIKAAYSRILAASLSGMEITWDFEKRILNSGLGLQLIDDFRDYSDDSRNNLFTPFTYFDRQKEIDFENPFTLFLRSMIWNVKYYQFPPEFCDGLANRLAQAVKKYGYYPPFVPFDEFLSIFPPFDGYARELIEISRLRQNVNNLGSSIGEHINQLVINQIKESTPN